MKAQELRNLSREELKEKVISLKKSLFDMRTQGSSGRIEKPSQIKLTRRDIARVLTILREKKGL
ncbi:MAG: 50S ribosomal protein L29 [Candidatus Omnitrophica bacterium]|nr:50S ribosomal protein L29 [Candidatus Omnitrophota bacterium]